MLGLVFVCHSANIRVREGSVIKQVIETLIKLAGLEAGKIDGIIRRHPLFGNEIHIDEELSNLTDSLDLYLRNQKSMKEYPAISKHTRSELQASLNHCLSILWRMAHGEKLGYAYNEKYLRNIIKEVTRVMVEAVQLTNNHKLISGDAYKLLYPLMTLNQRRRFQTKQAPIVAYLRVLSRRPQPLLSPAA